MDTRKHVQLTEAIVRAQTLLEQVRVATAETHSSLTQTLSQTTREIDALIKATLEQDAVFLQRKWQWDKLRVKVQEELQKKPPPPSQKPTNPPKRRSPAIQTGNALSAEDSEQRILIGQQQLQQRVSEYEALARDMEHVRDIQVSMNQITMEQQKPLEMVELNCVSANEHTGKAAEELVKTSKYKYAAAGFGIMGAVVGAAVAGPIGLIVGVKSGIGVAACVAAGAVTGGVATQKVGDVIHDGNVKRLEGLGPRAIQ